MTLGQIVYSKSGRDSGKAFVVVDIDKEEGCVFISDGNMRRFEKAKKKNIKHIEPMEFVDQDIQSKLLEDGRVTNSQIRKALSGGTIGAPAKPVSWGRGDAPECTNSPER